VNSLRAVIRKHWGHTSFRPLQREAMTAAVDGRDSLVVLPTGGGKSLCYQAPALLSQKPTVVVSPLIALMKDQVDQLIWHGVEAAFFNSSLEPSDRRLVMAGIERRQYKLIFVAPERFASDGFLQLLAQSGVGSFAVDEAHCISHWGHDFRGDYRQLGQLKKRFAGVAVHAFTATATPHVCRDIVGQLGLDDPTVLVGDFFRPNLIYQVHRRKGGFGQVFEAVGRRAGQAGIVYCIRRTDVDELSAMLRAAGIKAVGYHAGMTDQQRSAAQDAFAAGLVDVVVATVAFGMGIDRPDIRYVIHAAMPKSIEHYQQETGRAGRDGEPADCILFFSGGDFALWKRITEKTESLNRDDQLRMLSDMYRYCTGMRCRHRQLVEYFGQSLDEESCKACDVCNGTFATMPDSTVVAQKIMSCVVRTQQRYGPGYISDLLRGTSSDRAAELGHDQLSTFGLIGERPKAVLMAWIDQLVDQDLLRQDGDYRVLEVTDKGWQVLRGQGEATLRDFGGGRRPKKRPRTSPAKKRAGKAKRERGEPPVAMADDEIYLDGEGLALFEQLRELRRHIAGERKVPAFMIFSDRALRGMARSRPTNRVQMLAVKGVGPVTHKNFGQRFIEEIADYLSRRGS